MNRINRLFQEKSGNILSIYFTAGHPRLDSTPFIIRSLEQAGADMIEIGIPFSDPLADGPVIQRSSDQALKNGMSLKLLFSQLKDIRRDVDIPLLLMGYLNPVLQYGVERFCAHCMETGIDGIILPDMPYEVYTGDVHQLTDLSQVVRSADSDSVSDKSRHVRSIQDLFNHHNLHNIFLISPQTSTERIGRIDRISRGFIYMVSASSTTGIKGSFSESQIEYFRHVQNLKLQNPRLIGFGISDHATFDTACKYAHGAIIGSAFIRMLSETSDLEGDIRKFIIDIKG